MNFTTLQKPFQRFNNSTPAGAQKIKRLREIAASFSLHLHPCLGLDLQATVWLYVKSVQRKYRWFSIAARESVGQNIGLFPGRLIEKCTPGQEIRLIYGRHRHKASWPAYFASCGADYMQICNIHILIPTPWTNPDAEAAKVYLAPSL